MSAYTRDGVKVPEMRTGLWYTVPIPDDWKDGTVTTARSVVTDVSEDTITLESLPVNQRETALFEVHGLQTLMRLARPMQAP